jgi:hypothetical protein
LLRGRTSMFLLLNLICRNFCSLMISGWFTVRVLLIWVGAI